MAEPGRFSIGLVLERNRQRNRRPPPPPPPPKKKHNQKPITVNFKDRVWCIVPCKSPIVGVTICGLGKTITSVIQAIHTQMRDPGVFGQYRKDILRGCFQLAKRNQRFIQMCRKLLRSWLARRIRPSNEEDLVTGEVPQDPIVLVEWNARRSYSFEVNTIRRYMLERVLQSSYLFPTYALPRNPYTNVDMSQMQYLSILKQLRARQTTHWALEALAACNYDITRLKKEFGPTIHQYIVKSQLTRLNNPEVIELVHEFIDDQHNDHAMNFCSNLYKWALNNHTGCHRIRKWVGLCKDYYMARYNFPDVAGFEKEVGRIRMRSEMLCSVPRDLMIEKSERFKQGLLAQRKATLSSRVGAGQPASSSTP